MPTRRGHDHVGSYRFKVEISGVTAGSFQSVSEFGAEAEVIEYQDGDDLALRKRPGRVRYDDIVLSKGYILTDDLWNWWNQVQSGQVQRMSMSIFLTDSVGDEIKRWNLYECWPRRWQTGPLNAEQSDRLVEQIVIVTERVELA